MQRSPVYLDSNVVIDVFEGHDDELLGLLLRSVYSGPYCYPFSAELISEITDVEFPESSEQRMFLVGDLSRRVYFENSFTRIGFRQEMPEAVFKTINEVPFDYASYFSNFISFEQISEARKAFGFDGSELNNMKPLEAIRHIDNTLENFHYPEVLTTQEPPRSMKEMISMVSAMNDDASKSVEAGLGEKVEHDNSRKDLIMFFSLLDTFGYWGDPKKKYKKGSRLADAQHALVGSYYSAVVSRDIHFIQKARAAYDYMGISTKTHFTSEFKLHLKELLANIVKA